MVFGHIFDPFIRAALLLGILLFGSVFVAPVLAQTSTNEPKTVETGDPKSDLKASLSSLLTLSQNEVQRLEKQHNISQGLYKDGLLARVELENSEKALALGSCVNLSSCWSGNLPLVREPTEASSIS